MATVTLSIPKLGVTEKGWESSKEIYVLGFVTDGRGAEDRSQQFIAAHNETLPDIRPEFARNGVGRYLHVSASNIFRRIRADQPLSLSGSGIVLYPNLDPKGFLAAHLFVVEHDGGVRRAGEWLGKLLDRLAEDSGIGSVLKLIPGVIDNAIPFAGLMKAVGQVVPELLKDNKDDPLCQHLHAGFDFDNYGLTEDDSGVEDFPIGNDRAFGTLRVRVRRSQAKDPA